MTDMIKQTKFIGSLIVLGAALLVAVATGWLVEGQHDMLAAGLLVHRQGSEERVDLPLLRRVEEQLHGPADLLRVAADLGARFVERLVDPRPLLRSGETRRVPFVGVPRDHAEHLRLRLLSARKA